MNVIADESVKRHVIVMSMARQIRTREALAVGVAFSSFLFLADFFFSSPRFNMETEESLSFSQGIDTHLV
jgi:hypothetical protein